MDFKEKSYVPNPRATTNPISKLFFWWMVPVFRKGAKKDLILDDIYNVLREDVADKLGSQLALAWDKEIRKSKMKQKKARLYKAIISIFWRSFLWTGVYGAINEWIVRVAQSLCLKWLVESFSMDSENNENHRLNQYLYAGGICLTTFLTTLLLHPSVFAIQHIGMKIRIACSSLIYRKVLKVSKATEKQASVGQLVNLLSNDVNRFDVNLMMLNYFYIGPIQTIIFTYLLWDEFGPASMGGTGLILLLMPLQYYVGKMFAIYRFKIAQKTDNRGKIMNEIIIAIRVIKMYAWEKPFSLLIDRVRRLEVAILRKAAYLRAVYLSLFISSAKTITFATFLAYILIDENNVLSADKVFFAVAVYNVLRLSMVSYLPNAAANTGELIVSMNRIEEFLLTEEQKVGDNIRLLLQAGVAHGEHKVIKMDSVCASWTGDKPTLNNLDIALEGDQLVIVCGPVGSGKSALLHALITELPIVKGKCLIQGKTTYAAQEPWIFSGNLRQNILFGHPYEETRYNEIIQVCALEDDLNQLPYGDNTVVGERGVSLSGGQKARVNLARALYDAADIYLLDDPLSAVDSRVSRHIFEKCIKNHLTGSLRILVTHQLQYLPQADRIIVFNEGEILAQGTYKELVELGIDFVSLMSSETDEDATNRKESVVSKIDELIVASKEDKVGGANPDGQLEKMAVGSVTGRLYWDYFSSGSSMLGLGFLAFAFIFNQVLFNSSEIWLSSWTNEEERKAEAEALENSGSTTASVDESGYLGRNTYIYVYSGITAGIFILTTWRAGYYFHYCMAISINIHNKMFGSIVRAPTKFFDDNPSGRVMNRFTKDLGSMDELLPTTSFDAISIFFSLIGVMVVIVFSNYYMIVPTLILAVLFALMHRFYIRTARDVKRIESIARSPLFTHVAASLQGLTTIRTSKSQTLLIHQFDGHQDLHSAAWYVFISANRWFAIWLEMISVAFLVVVTLGFLFATDAMGGSVGLAISSALTLTGMLQWGMRQSAETENLMTSVERALEYSKIEPEAELDSKPDKMPPKEWPSEGKIEFKNIYLAYEDKPVLKDLTFDIQGKEKIGIVGRTGAGKSSIIAALFRMTEPSGDILVDGVRVNDIGLHCLRRSISIIPQDPVLFSGTIRYNLDPFDQFQDSELWQALTEVDLKDEIPALDFKVSDAGSNFSIGQRQLVCLARAILRNNQIIVMDEATANVDPRTDNLIQTTIRQKFASCTIITIAHRLHSVMDCDRILVLDNGFLKEYDHPHILLQNPDGILTSMIRHTGKASSEILQKVAADTYSGRKGSFRVESLKILQKIPKRQDHESDD